MPPAVRQTFAMTLLTVAMQGVVMAVLYGVGSVVLSEYKNIPADIKGIREAVSQISTDGLERHIVLMGEIHKQDLKIDKNAESVRSLLLMEEELRGRIRTLEADYNKRAGK